MVKIGSFTFDFIVTKITNYNIIKPIIKLFSTYTKQQKSLLMKKCRTTLKYNWNHDFMLIL